VSFTVTYQEYPLLLFTSYTKETRPDLLVFRSVDNKGSAYLKNGKVGEIFDFIVAMNELGESGIKHTNYCMSDSLYARMDRNHEFRNKRFQYFLQNKIKSETGIILLNKGRQYVYIILSEDEKKVLGEGANMLVGFFHENVLLQVEEAYIEKSNIEVLDSGYYMDAAPSEKGHSLTFVMVFLGYLMEVDNLQIMQKENETSESILFVV
jgi:hypothetical protein